MSERSLRQRRLTIHPDSLESMKTVRSAYASIEDDFPVVQGIGFFGSRILGRERQTSDLDLILFCDYESFDGRMESMTQSEFAASALREQVHNSGLPVPKLQVLTCNIGPGAIRHSMGHLCSGMLNDAPFSKRDLFRKNDYVFIGPTVLPFLLSIGDGVYEARKYILDHLETSEAGRKHIFPEIIDTLDAFERSRRDVPPFVKRPRTIQEAREYFCL